MAGFDNVFLTYDNKNNPDGAGLQLHRMYGIYCLSVAEWSKADAETVVITSDCDEIPKPQQLRRAPSSLC